MEGFVQVGVTALRDPVTLEFLPAVPLYVAAEDVERLGPGQLVWAGQLGEQIRKASEAENRAD